VLPPTVALPHVRLVIEPEDISPTGRRAARGTNPFHAVNTLADKILEAVASPQKLRTQVVRTGSRRSDYRI
jgi:hypothetical protein